MAEKFILRLLQNATVLIANETIDNSTSDNSTSGSGSGEGEEESSSQMIVLFFGFVTLLFCKKYIFNISVLLIVKNWSLLFSRN